MPLNLQILSKYKTECFVETGTYNGDGVNIAIQCGFPLVKSIELYRENYERCVKKFENHKEVSLFHGSSAEILEDVISDINVRCTFWLDAHFSGKRTAKGLNGERTAILDEIKQIANHKRKDHIIMIDDIREFGTENFDYITLKNAQEEILKINPNYLFQYDTGDTRFENDILIATL
jgi:hypothetical protein